ncbi:PAS domain-containing sensor histidine kinase [Rufibacter hautae]|uniref:histidine kinase n=1 Tax=Rufibacter hautae TaxID=2595005 RepID=A0A5B6TFA1_9BACT|nr:PAS domain-containing sensor histidine kinase [Rufibacter hautae]KAA3438044.1 PAS domain S-box protein [Rufibacter hautae]
MIESQILTISNRINWEKMTELSLDLFCTLDNNRFYQYASEACVDMLGYRSWEMEGMHYTDLVHPDDKTQTQQAFWAASSGTRQKFENRMIHKDGQEVWVLWSVAWSEEEGTLFCVGRDITDFKFKEQKSQKTEQRFKPVFMKEVLKQQIVPQLSDTQEETGCKETKLQLSQLTKDLIRKNADLQQFTYIVSHNLRTPVANAMGLANLLATTDRNSASFDRSLSYLRLSLYRMDNVLRDMNTILTIRDRRGNVEREQVNVKEVILQAMSSLEDQLRSAGATINLDITDGLTVQANKAYFYSIILNLLSNSVKYRAEERKLEVNIHCYRKSKTEAAISFSDNGSGFDMEKNRNNVFKLYKRFHTHTEGRGMGLFLIKTHLDSLGGRIEVDSQVGQGTCFQINLP